MQIKQSCCLLLFILTCFKVLAFSQQKGEITGNLTDSTGKKPVVYATVTVFSAADTTIITYRMTDEMGGFKIPGLPLNKPLRVVITATGYQVIRREFQLSTDSSSINFKKIVMLHDVHELEEVLVFAERPPVVVKKDTIEFNATAFKTLPNALVEDLLKKMPGVEVDKEGNIKVNGRAVNRLLVEGREFFGNDPKIATKNLPANLIDKVQVTDDKEQLERDPDTPPALLGQVVNLKLKKAIKKGWFGKLYAGGGTDERYEAGGIANLFRDTLQVSLIGYSNNLNRSGFGYQDIMNIGGFNRSSASSVAISSSGGLMINDISFGGFGGGLEKSSGAGVNANTITGKNTKISLQYFYGNSRNIIQQQIQRQQFFADTVLYTSQMKQSERYDNNHRISGFVDAQLSPTARLTYRPSFSTASSKTTGTDSTVTTANYQPIINKSTNLQSLSDDGFATQHELFFNKKFKKTGRTLTASANFQLNAKKTDTYNTAENEFYKTQTTTELRQLRNQNVNSGNTGLIITYIEPLAKQQFIRISQNISFFKNEDDIASYSFNPAAGNYDLPENQFTNGINRLGIRNNTSASIGIKIKKWTVTPGLVWRYLNIQNKFIQSPDILQNFSYLLPSLSLTKGTLYINASVNVTEPSINDLQPTVNNTNPLFINKGNPALKPSTGYNIMGNFNKYNSHHLYSFSINGNTSYTQNGVIRERYIDENGIQTTQPVNINGLWRNYASLGFDKQYKYSNNRKISLRPNVSAQYHIQPLMFNHQKSNSATINVSSGLRAAFNWNDKVELSYSYNNIWNNTSYTNNLYPRLNFWRQTTSTDLVIRMPKHIVWESNFNYTYNPQVAAGIQKNVFLWNAAVNLLLMKEDKGQLKLSVFDILNQNNSVTRSISENYINDTESLTLRRYFLLTFTYNIRNLGTKVGGQQRLLWF